MLTSRSACEFRNHLIMTGAVDHPVADLSFNRPAKKKGKKGKKAKAASATARDVNEEDEEEDGDIEKRT